MRFYDRDGWTEEMLRPLISSFVTDPPLAHKDAGLTTPYSWAYWVPEVGTVLDIKKLMKIVTKVDRTFNDHPHQTDEEFLQNYNW